MRRYLHTSVKGGAGRGVGEELGYKDALHLKCKKDLY